MTGEEGASRIDDCVDLCMECHAVCLETVAYSLQLGGRHSSAQHIRVLLDCAQMCQASADFLLRGSPLHALPCAACAEVCERCAEECEALRDEATDRCAELCRTCAAACREMAADTSGAHAA